MTRFLVIYHAPAELMAKMGTATPEEKEAGMKAWMDWKANNEDTVIDFGSPLMPGTRIHTDGSEENIMSDNTGYSIIQAENIDKAKAMLKLHPHLHWGDGCAITIQECIKM